MINWTFLRKHDPALINLRKAARTVLVAPPLFLFFDLYVGNHPNLYILLIPFYVFLAAYTPSTVGFAVGQASFTSMVVVFNFVKPLGISTDFVRIETVSLGAITATIVALILWPRGARAAIAQAVSDVYLAAAKGIRTGLRGSDEERFAVDQSLISAQQRAQAAFSMALSEHGGSINTGAWSRLSRPPAMVRSALEGLLRSLPKTAPEGCQAANARLDRLSDDLAQHLEKIGADLSKAKSSADAQRSNNTANDILPDLQECLAAGLARGTQGTDDALTIMAWCDWLTQLDLALQETGPALESVAAASAPRAWLHWSTPGR